MKDEGLIINKAPSVVQITAEQLLREAIEHQAEDTLSVPLQKITDKDELLAYQQSKRKGFEDNLRRQRHNIGAWIKYAKWEEQQREYERARSIWERALDVDPRNQTVWLKYIEMEMSNKYVNRARNIYERVISILPRIDQFWLKYALMEELLGNPDNCRQIFERWLEWEPGENAFIAYIQFESRQHDLDRCRTVYEKYIQIHPKVKTYLTYAKFEEKGGRISLSRNIYERCLEEMDEGDINVDFYTDYCRFETQQKEFERAKALYEYALKTFPKSEAGTLYQNYLSFEKQYGSSETIDSLIITRLREQFESQLKENKHNYDIWFDYFRLEEKQGNFSQIREIYERAIACLPPLLEKTAWQRYIYIWIFYALFEELIAKDYDRTRQVYQACLNIIPHPQFSFAKIWIMFAHFELRQQNLTMCRQILGTAIGKCKKEKLFRSYIDLEMQLGEIDRVRILYGKYIQSIPSNVQAWIKFAEFESSLEEYERARSIYELAINQSSTSIPLDLPEVLWKNYIDFEINLNQTEKARHLFSRLLGRTKHIKVWLSYVLFEATRDPKRARQIFEEGDNYFRRISTDSSNEERAMLMENWLDFEKNYGDEETISIVQKKQPRMIHKRTTIEGISQEYVDYLFPDDSEQAGSMKLLDAAKKWKKQKIEEQKTSNPEE